MDRKFVASLCIVAAAALLLALGFLLPPTSFPVLTWRPFPGGKGREGQGGPAPHQVRARAEIPVPRRYIEAARQDVAALMADPGWARLDPEVRRSRLMEVFIQRAADAEYWTMPEPRQRRVADAFVRAFLEETAAPGRRD